MKWKSMACFKYLIFFIVSCVSQLTYSLTPKTISGAIQNQTAKPVVENVDSLKEFLAKILKNLDAESFPELVKSINKKIKKAEELHAHDQNNKRKLELLYKLKELAVEMSQIVEVIVSMHEHFDIAQDQSGSDMCSADSQSPQVQLAGINTCIKNIVQVESSIADLQKKLDEVTKEKNSRREVLKKIPDVVQEDKKISGSSQSQDIEDLEKMILDYKKALSQLKVKEKEIETKNIELRIEQETKRLKKLKAQYGKSKTTLNYPQPAVDWFVSKVEIEAKKIHEKRNGLLKRFEDITKKIVQEEQSLLKSSGSTQFSIVIAKIDDLSQKGQQASLIRSLVNLIELYVEKEKLQVSLMFTKTELDKLEKEKLIAKAWSLVSSKRFDEDEVDGISEKLEIGLLKTNLEELQNKQDSVTTKLQENLSQLNYLKSYVEGILTKEAKKISNQTAAELKYIVNQVEYISQRIYTIIQTNTEEYSSASGLLRETVEQSQYVLNELKAKEFWQRSQHSIQITDLQNFVPEMKAFFQAFMGGFKPFVQRVVDTILLKRVESLTFNKFMWFLIALSLALLFALGMSRYMGFVQEYFASKSSDSPLAARMALLLDFIKEHVSLYFWLPLLIFVIFNYVMSGYGIALFYICSIPYMFFIVNSLSDWFLDTNTKRGYIFISHDHAERFTRILSLFFYLTVFTFFFREAFSALIPSVSVPTILLAVYIIAFQLILISLLQREQVLSFISSDSAWGRFAREFIEEYYHFFFVATIAIIIMINPYVGYGKQVIYVLTRSIITFIIIPLLVRMYKQVKKFATSFFFYYTDQETVESAIPGGKAWYSLFVLMSFVVMVSFGYFLLAYTWGFSIKLKDFYSYLTFNFISKKTVSTEHYASFNLITLFTILCFIVGGYIFTYILNKFILEGIFEPLMIGPGIQSTVFTLTKYVIGIIALLMGLYSVGLEGIITNIVFVLTAIGFAVKEPFSDFISYFIILVQRPIKVGDLISVDMGGAKGEVIGLVRQITPRATMLRQRNSYTVIIPNTQVLQKVVTNWNYIRGFTSTEDILLTVSINEDPEKVKKIILSAIDSHAQILKNPSPVVWCYRFTSSGYQFLVRAFMSNNRAIEFFEMSSQLRMLVSKELAHHGIQITSPHTVVQLNEPVHKNNDFSSKDLHSQNDI